ncbi:MAG: hypothetical protein WC645_08490, partial [Candidatus Margulisiibacteriota bacterium]
MVEAIAPGEFEVAHNEEPQEEAVDLGVGAEENAILERAPADPESVQGVQSEALKAELDEINAAVRVRYKLDQRTSAGQETVAKIKDFFANLSEKKVFGSKHITYGGVANFAMGSIIGMQARNVGRKMLFATGVKGAVVAAALGATFGAIRGGVRENRAATERHFGAKAWEAELERHQDKPEEQMAIIKGLLADEEYQRHFKASPAEALELMGRYHDVALDLDETRLEQAIAKQGESSALAKYLETAGGEKRREVLKAIGKGAVWGAVTSLAGYGVGQVFGHLLHGTPAEAQGAGPGSSAVTGGSLSAQGPQEPLQVPTESVGANAPEAEGHNLINWRMAGDHARLAINPDTGRFAPGGEMESIVNIEHGGGNHDIASVIAKSITHGYQGGEFEMTSNQQSDFIKHIEQYLNDHADAIRPEGGHSVAHVPVGELNSALHDADIELDISNLHNIPQDQPAGDNIPPGAEPDDGSQGGGSSEGPADTLPPGTEEAAAGAGGTDEDATVAGTDQTPDPENRPEVTEGPPRQLNPEDAAAIAAAERNAKLFAVEWGIGIPATLVVLAVILRKIHKAKERREEEEIDRRAIQKSREYLASGRLEAEWDKGNKAYLWFKDEFIELSGENNGSNSSTYPITYRRPDGEESVIHIDEVDLGKIIYSPTPPPEDEAEEDFRKWVEDRKVKPEVQTLCERFENYISPSDATTLYEDLFKLWVETATASEREKRMIANAQSNILNAVFQDDVELHFEYNGEEYKMIGTDPVRNERLDVEIEIPYIQASPISNPENVKVIWINDLMATDEDSWFFAMPDAGDQDALPNTPGVSAPVTAPAPPQKEFEPTEPARTASGETLLAPAESPPTAPHAGKAAEGTILTGVALPPARSAEALNRALQLRRESAARESAAAPAEPTPSPAVPPPSAADPSPPQKKVERSEAENIPQRLERARDAAEELGAKFKQYKDLKIFSGEIIGDKDKKALKEKQELERKLRDARVGLANAGQEDIDEGVSLVALDNAEGAMAEASSVLDKEVPRLVRKVDTRIENKYGGYLGSFLPENLPEKAKYPAFSIDHKGDFERLSPEGKKKVFDRINGWVDSQTTDILGSFYER